MSKPQIYLNFLGYVHNDAHTQKKKAEHCKSKQCKLMIMDHNLSFYFKNKIKSKT